MRQQGLVWCFVLTVSTADNLFIVCNMHVTKKHYELPNMFHWNIYFFLDLNLASIHVAKICIQHLCSSSSVEHITTECFSLYSLNHVIIPKHDLATPWDNLCTPGYWLQHSHKVWNTLLIEIYVTDPFFSLILLSNNVIQTFPLSWLCLFPVLHKELVSTVAKFWFIRVEGVISGSLESLGLITEPSEL